MLLNKFRLCSPLVTHKIKTITKPIINYLKYCPKLLTSSIFIAKIWEPPNISKPYDGSGHSQQKFNLVCPLASLFGT